MTTLVDSCFYVFGGRDAVTQYNDLHAFDLNTQKWKPVVAPSATSSNPSPRYFHASIAHNNKILIIWGKNMFDFGFSTVQEFVFGSNGMISLPLPAHTPDTSTPKEKGSSKRDLNTKKLKVKCLYQNEMRVMSLNTGTSYTDFVSKLNEEYKDSLKIQYEDDDGDLITIRSGADLKEAMSHFSGGTKASKLLLSSDDSNSIDLSESDKKSRTSSLASKASAQPLNNSQILPNLSSSQQTHVTNAPIKWQSGGVIGEGAFGKVVLAMNVDTGELIAIKQVPINAEPTQQIQALQREIELMQVSSQLHYHHLTRSEFVSR